MTIAETLKTTSERLSKAGLVEAAMESEFLVAELLGRSRAELLRRSSESIPETARARIEQGIQARESRKPLAYITGQQPFLDLSLEVTPDVLIPRPETEQLAEKILKSLDALENPTDLIDVGTGSGNLAIALSRHPKIRRAYGFDRSPKALAVAQANAQRLGLAAKCEWRVSDCLSAFSGDEPLVIVANLPYIRTSDLQTLAPELQWEPVSALDGGEKGLDIVERLIAQAEEKTPSGTVLWLEIGHDQAPAVQERFAVSRRWIDIQVENDWALWPRFVRAVRGER